MAPTQNQWTSTRPKIGQVTCYNCGQKGHIKKIARHRASPGNLCPEMKTLLPRREERKRAWRCGSLREEFSHNFKGTVVTSWVCPTVCIADCGILWTGDHRGIYLP